MNNTKQKKFNFGAYFAKYKFQLIIFVLVYIITSLIDIFTTIYLAKFIELLTLGKFAESIRLVIIISVVLVIQQTLYLFNGLMRAKLNVNITNSISIDIAEQAFKISSSAYSNHNTATFIQRIASDPQTIFTHVLIIIDYLTECISAIVIVIYLSFLNIWIGIICATLVVTTTIIEKIRRKKRKKNRKAMIKSYEKVNSFLTEIVKSERDIKSLNLEKTLKSRTTELYNDYKNKTLHYEKDDWSMFYCRRTLNLILQAILLVVSVVLMDKSLITLATFMIIYSNKDSLFRLTQIFSNINDCFTEISVASNRINELFQDDEYELEKFGKRKLKDVKGKVEFKNISFTYVEYAERDKKIVEREKKYNKKHKIDTLVPTREIKSKNQVFKDLNFTIEPNTTVAFVGVSGSGKSTILNLISKINVVDKGRVLIDGVNINSLDKDTIRSSIALVNQFPYIFDMTIKDNLLMAKPDATDEELQSAIKDSALEEFVNTLPDGIDTRVGESGIKLSGGQKQRLAIARALVKKSSIILFDESTSSLDNLAQNHIKESIDNIKGKSTVVIVAHRLSTIKNVDKIFFLEQGKIVDTGTFDELFSRNPSFKNIFLAEDV